MINKTKPNTSYIVRYEKDNTFDSDKFLKLRLRVCHDGVSPNNTFFTKQTMEAAKNSLEYIPILAHTVYDKNGKPVFGAHDTHIEEDKLNPGQQRMIYDEIPIGLVPSNSENNQTIEEFEGKNYQFVDAYIWRDYSNYCEQLLEDAVDSKLSMEISIPDDKLSYNAKEKYWDIAEYKYRGITMLNSDCGTGMKNALATTENFELNNDSLKEKMLILMEQLQNCLHDYNKNENQQKGGNTVKFNELLEKYDKTVEDITFEYENLSDEELEAKFAEAFEEVGTDGEGELEPASDGDIGEDLEPDNNEPNVETEGETVAESEPQIETDYSKSNLFQKLFEISFDEIRYALNALCSCYRNDDEWCYVSRVYEEYFIMEDWDNEKYYKQSYTKDGDKISLSGERIEMFNIMVTESEKIAIEDLRTNYSSIQEKLEKLEAYEKDALKSQKEAIFNKESYCSYLECDEFVSLKNDMDNYSVEELTQKAELAFAKCVQKLGFSLEEKPIEKKHKRVATVTSYSEDTKSSYNPYGDLFDEE